MVRPSSRNRRTKAATNAPWVAGVPEPRNPMIDNLPGCCARGERPSRRCTAKQRDEVAAPHGACPKAKDHEPIIALCIAAKSGYSIASPEDTHRTTTRALQYRSYTSRTPLATSDCPRVRRERDPSQAERPGDHRRASTVQGAFRTWNAAQIRMVESFYSDAHTAGNS